jgi:hypothetical protein
MVLVVILASSANVTRQNGNGDAGRAEGKTESVRSLNSYLELMQRKVYDARQQLLHHGHPVTAENVKTVFFGKEIQTQKYMLMEVFKKHNDPMAELVGLEYAPGALERFQTAYRHTLTFLQLKYKVDDIDISKLDYEFISEYEFWIKSVRKCNHNSTIKYLTNFRKVINRCVRNGWLPKDPFANFKMTLREVERIALTETELQNMVAQQFPTDPAADRARHFSVQLLHWAGLRRCKEA